jgi:predicted transcriptional regulator
MDLAVQGEKEIMAILSEIPTSSREIEKRLNKIQVCPDEIVRLLNRLRKKGIISGCLNRELGEWVWWINRIENQ